MIKKYDEIDFKNIQHSIINEDEVNKEIYANPFGNYLLYVEKKSILGYIYYSEIYDRVEINQIEVEEHHRKLGIGSKLISEVIKVTKKDITLEVKVDNYPAINLYDKFNFKKIAIRKGYYKGIDAILMKRECN